ncbi:MAG: Rap1a/Tai family immunity protein [Pseudomonadota bacterium]
MFVWLMIAAAILPVPPVPAQPLVTARQLQVSCTSTWGHRAYYEMYAACRAYVSAVVDTVTSTGPRRVCLPVDADRGLVTETVVKAFGGRLVSEEREGRSEVARSPVPELSGSAADFVVNVLAREFPCE